MIKTLVIEKETLERLDIPTRIDRSIPRKIIPDKEAVELGDNFEIWTLLYRDVRTFIKNNGSDFSREPNLEEEDIVRNSRQVHHQIMLDKKRIAYGRSEATRGSSGEILSLKLEGLFVSQTAIKINTILKWAKDKLQDNDLTLRLLLAPEFQLTAFWVVGRGAYGNKIIPIKYAPELKKHFKPREPISSKDFLIALADVKPITGIRWILDE